MVKVNPAMLRKISLKMKILREKERLHLKMVYSWGLKSLQRIAKLFYESSLSQIFKLKSQIKSPQTVKISNETLETLYQNIQISG